jgi:hypothetical protein
MISVLRRKLHDNERFNDFYNSWFLSKESCHPITNGGQTYQQHFPASTRVINGIKIDDKQEIISIGITWVKNDAEKEGLMAYIEKAKKGEDRNNEARHNKIKEVAEGELIGLFLAQTDDNLGTPF